MLKKCKYRIFPLLLTFALTLGLSPLAAAADEPADPITYGISTVDAVVTPYSAKLPAPTNVAWGPNYSAEFDKVAGAEGLYEVNLYRNGQQVYRGSWRGLLTDSLSVGLAAYFNESGSYYFTVMARGQTEAENSDIVTSTTVTYTKPSQVLPTPAYLRWEEGENEFWAMWAPFEGIADVTYFVQLYIESEYGMEEKSSIWGSLDCRASFDSNFGMDTPGNYSFTVQAISTDLDTWGNGAISAHSPIYNLGEVIDNTGGNVANLLDDVNDGVITPSEMRDELSDLNNASLASSMQGDSGVLNTIRELERIYNEDMGITVSTAVDPAISGSMGSGGISIVGAGLNTQTPGQDMVLRFSQPASAVVVDESQYRNWVQFEIDLEGADDSANLDVPVQITMPVPVGVVAESLCILHYHMDGTYETIWPNVNANGTVTFTITRFSVFVFANEAVPDGGDGGDSGGGSGSSNWGRGSSSGGSGSSSGGITVYGGQNAAGAAITAAVGTTPARSSNVDANGAVNAAAINSELVGALASAGGNTATIRTRNAESISPAVLKALAGTAAAAGKTAILQADTLSGAAVQGRLYVEPAKLTGLSADLKLGVYTEAGKTSAVKAHYEKYFSGNVAVVSLEQTGSLGARLQVAAKVDLTGLDTANLVFYTHDRATNRYQRIANPDYFVDASGYLHFYTEQGGSIVISSGMLQKR